MKHPEDTAASLLDTQNESDHRRIVIDRVGVKNLRFPIQVAVGPGAPQSTIATVQLTVELPQEFKGTHMSRFSRFSRPTVPYCTPSTSKSSCARSSTGCTARGPTSSLSFPFFSRKRHP